MLSKKYLGYKYFKDIKRNRDWFYQVKGCLYKAHLELCEKANVDPFEMEI
jgi:hypothetical protein